MATFSIIFLYLWISQEQNSTETYDQAAETKIGEWLVDLTLLAKEETFIREWLASIKGISSQQVRQNQYS